MDFKQYLQEINESMKISKTTHKYAMKRNLELIVDDETVAFYTDYSDTEPMFFYSISETGELFFKSNIWLKQETKEELPYWINSEKELRRVLDFVSKEIEKDKSFYS